MGICAGYLALDGFHHGLEGISTAEDQIDAVAFQPELMLTGKFKQGFELVSQTVDRAQIEEP
ncbi:hypothetical protein SDC9_183971 [bioreactor metagenome]|uniref:Uncharacterized protein n=1 Tax=bioreactor metagenome TaxID=1076179 RepID=A0A645HDM2_9ZZZZ